MRVSARSRAGFTLVELAIVLVLLGILLGVLAPRAFNSVPFASRGFADQLIAQLRFARELAIAQRAPVYVLLDSKLVRFCLDAGCSQPATAADGSTPFQLAAPGAISLAGSASFSFDGLGRPDLASSLPISVLGEPALIVTVEADTGYVH